MAPSAKENAREFVAWVATEFWKQRSTAALQTWIFINAIIFIALELMGLIPGLSHIWDFLTLVIFDEVIQMLLVAPAIKELWRRRQLQEEVKEMAEKMIAYVSVTIMREWVPTEQYVEIEVQDFIPPRPNLRYSEVMALGMVIEKMEGTGLWTDGNAELDLAEHKVLVRFSPSENLRKRAIDGQKRIPLLTGPTKGDS
ncbi:MAG: hypothetical protein ABIA47_02730 [bacterium]